jgi:hypothetical protein
MPTLVIDKGTTVLTAAIEVHIRRAYHAFCVVDVEFTERDGRFECIFSVKYSYKRDSDAPLRQGGLSVVPSMGALKSGLPAMLESLSKSIGCRSVQTESGLLDNFLVAIADGAGIMNLFLAKKRRSWMY